MLDTVIVENQIGVIVIHVTLIYLNYQRSLVTLTRDVYLQITIINKYANGKRESTGIEAS